MASLYDQLSSLQMSLSSQGLEKAMSREGRRPFWSYAGYSMRLAMEEKEIILFAFLQWVSVLGAYLVGIEVLNWLPEFQPGWAGGAVSVESNVFFVIWMLTCVALAALPVGVLTGSMAASHFLRHHGRESTIIACMGLALHHTGRLWAFHAIDGFVTVWRMLSRLPGKKEGSGIGDATAELGYYGWKVVSAAAVPTLLLAETTGAAMKASGGFLKADLVRIARLRAAYSGACWVLAIAVGVSVFAVFKLSPREEVSLYEVYFRVAAPLGAGLAILMLLLRPVFVLSICHLYSDHVSRMRQAARAVTQS